MALKRTRSAENLEHNAPYDRALDDDQRQHASTSSPAKRFRILPPSPLPCTPIAAARFRPTTAFSTPAKKMPYPTRAYDSPSNPFGRKHTESLIRSLPPPCSYSKHLALRFQFVRKGVPNKNRKGGVHRIVQVPTSYTFVHLRCLIEFLFGGAIPLYHRRTEGEEIDHLFEIKKDVEVYSASYKPGQIRKGQTWAKLSSTRDPCRWREEEEDVDDSEDIDEAEEQGRLLEEEHDDWEWKDEEDFTIAHAWPDGLDLERGIVYYHSRTTQVHITINNDSVPRRRGSGNTPHVFSAQGRVHLSPMPLPRLRFEAPPLPTTPKRKSPAKQSTIDLEFSDVDAEGEFDNDSVTDVNDNQEFDENHPFNDHNHRRDDELSDRDDDKNSDDDDDEEEDFLVDMNPKKWNSPRDAFSKYLRGYMGPRPNPKKPITLFDDDDEEEEEEYQSDYYGDEALDDTLICTPDLITSTSSSPPPGSSSPGLPLPMSSSPQKYPSSLGPSSAAKVRIQRQLPSPSVYLSPSSRALGSGLNFFLKAKYKQTPAPPKAKVHRMRIERVERRIERSKRGFMNAAAAAAAAKAEAQDQGEGENDEGGDEGGDEGEGEEEEDENGLHDGGGEEEEGNDGEVWDPFGDFIEL